MLILLCNLLEAQLTASLSTCPSFNNWLCLWSSTSSSIFSGLIWRSGSQFSLKLNFLGCRKKCQTICTFRFACCQLISRLLITYQFANQDVTIFIHLFNIYDRHQSCSFPMIFLQVCTWGLQRTVVAICGFCDPGPKIVSATAHPALAANVQRPGQSGVTSHPSTRLSKRNNKAVISPDHFYFEEEEEEKDEKWKRNQLLLIRVAATKYWIRPTTTHLSIERVLLFHMNSTWWNLTLDYYYK